MSTVGQEKRLKVLHGYLSGEAYDGIAAAAEVSNSTVLNIIPEFKDRRTPGLEGLKGLAESFPELAVKLKRHACTHPSPGDKPGGGSMVDSDYDAVLRRQGGWKLW